MQPERITYSGLMERYPDYTSEQKQILERAYQEALAEFEKQIVVLDDDPTGTQTVHDIYVFTDLTEGALRDGFSDENGMFYLLTNSRSFSEEKTARVHREIAKGLLQVSDEKKKDFLLISRGDSTLRGYYPLETDTLRETLEEGGYPKMDGLILCPFFPEGGRYTAGDIHYCLDGDGLVPAAQTEFARDATFGYTSSNLKEYVEEKSHGAYPTVQVVSITLEELRGLNWSQITGKLMQAHDFTQIVVNALNYDDLKVFATAFFHAIGRGKHFLIRSAAGLPRILGGIAERPFLRKEDLIEADNQNGGLVIVGSHVKKTNQQLDELAKLSMVEMIEFSVRGSADPDTLSMETQRVVRLAEQVIRSGRTAVVYTSRQLLLPDTGDPQEALRISTEISRALTDVVSQISVEPSFLVGKGGITSSDVAVRGLGIRKALVVGQADKGIPIWRQGEEARFPGRPYIVFPGNVGTPDSLKNIVKQLA